MAAWGQRGNSNLNPCSRSVEETTRRLLKVLRKALPLVQTALKLPGAWGLLGRLDGALQSGLMPAPAEVSRRGRSERT